MKKLEVWQELPKCDTETWNKANAIRKVVPVELLDAELPQIFDLLKNTVSAKYNEMRYACISSISPFLLHSHKSL